jgi:hypothetical protein
LSTMTLQPEDLALLFTPRKMSAVDMRGIVGNRIASINSQPVTLSGNVLLALADAKRRRRRKAVHGFEVWGTTTLFRLWHALHAPKTLFCLRTKKGLTRNGTLWRIAPRLPSPLLHPFSSRR